jgi:DMSO/TMAO reductase YedYZ molybdopterin-dependent catalytic subunit
MVLTTSIRMSGPVAAIMLYAAALAGPARAEGAPGFQLDGFVQHPQNLTLAQLKTMPSLQVDVTTKAMSGTEHRAWTGVLLWTLVKLAALKDEPGKNAGLRHGLMVRGKDGYAVLLSMGEIDPANEGKQVIIAYRKVGDQADLPGLRLVVPGDAHGSRQVHDVVEVEVR